METTNLTSHRLYLPLQRSHQEIRLLSIQPSADPESVIERSLRTIQLKNEPPAYIALSYVWGPPTPSQTILVNNISFSITPNLFVALRKIRNSQILMPPTSFSLSNDENNGQEKSKAWPESVWIDAICINQADVLERSSQVGIMQEIYKNAVIVVSWLGEEGQGSKKAMIGMRDIAREIKTLEPGGSGDKMGWLKRYAELLDGSRDEAGGNDGKTETVWDAIDRLWDRDYWTRTWVLQETVLAKRVIIMCGDELILWDDVLVIDSWSKSIKSSDPRPEFVTPSQWRMFAIGQVFVPGPVLKNMLLRKAWQYQNSEIDAGGVNGLYVLELERDLKASDPRDKVYGFLGLTRVGIIPDYKKDVREVYIETALHLLRLTGITRTLHLAGMESEQKFELPSWVPNWTSRQTGLYLKPSFFDVETVGDTMSNIDTSEEGVLKVIGLQLSSVVELEPELSRPLNDSGRATTRIWHFCRHYLANHGSKPYRTGIPFLQAMIRLLLDAEDPLNSNSKISIPSDAFFKLGAAFIGVVCADGENKDLEFGERCHRNLPKLGLDPDDDFAKTFSKQFLGDSEVLGPWENATQALYGNFAAYLTIIGVMLRVMSNRCLFCTKDGWIGIGPEELMKGDLVCAVKNCQFPVLLRPEDDHFLLVGTTLIHGLMDGAILAELDSRSSSVQEFKIW